MPPEQGGVRELACALAGDGAVLAHVGGGAFAHVFHLHRPSEPAAGQLGIKVQRGRLHDNTQVTCMFEREYLTLRDLSHPRIPKAYGLINWGRRRALLFDYVNGETLMNVMAKRSITPTEALRHGRALLEVLSYLHARAPTLVHGDISPENLIVDSDGDLHLIDFGSVTQDKANPVAPGKPSYMSPEQAQGRPWSARSDLYQAGVVLYEMLTGQRFNPGTSSLARRAFATNPDVDIDAAIDLPFRAVLRRMLDPDPAARWPTASACLGALVRLRPSPDGDRVEAPPLAPSSSGR